ncbi:hypothetical protein KBI23_09150 [bacterium]|nr:hypothetical protein [bacterium]MBP9809283.1 hypothetical protein [bacterium]
MNLPAAGLLSSIAFLRPYLKKALVVATVLFSLGAMISMLHDIEYTGQDVSVRGWRIFTWLKAIVPKSIYADQDYRLTKPDTALFPLGLESLRPVNIEQGSIYDCRFLATVASLCASQSGRRDLFSHIEARSDCGYSVYFPGVNQTVVVSKLSPYEVLLYAKAKDQDCKNAGIWLAVLEKAYGQYRNQHQNLFDQARRFCKHAILEGRFTASSELPGFAAAYGATDDQAAVLLSTRSLTEYKTFSFECGEFGFGKGYVTLRQLSSWFNRDQVSRNFASEQDAALRKALANGLLGIATTELNGDCQAYGLMSGHAYGILGYNPKKRSLRLKDPFGRGDLRRANSKKALDGIDDGVFEIGLTDFNLLFSHLRLAD